MNPHRQVQHLPSINSPLPPLLSSTVGFTYGYGIWYVESTTHDRHTKPWLFTIHPTLEFWPCQGKSPFVALCESYHSPWHLGGSQCILNELVILTAITWGPYDYPHSDIQEQRYLVSARLGFWTESSRIPKIMLFISSYNGPLIFLPSGECFLSERGIFWIKCV